MLVKILVIFIISTIGASLCELSIVDTATILLLKKCFSDHLSTLVIAGQTDTEFRENLVTVPVVLLENNSSKTENRLQYVELTSFLLRVDTEDDLKVSIELLKKLSNWNNRAKFFISKVSNQDCKEARSFLQVAWQMDILSTIFICNSNETHVKLYAYNPYTDRAPVPWVPVLSDKRWTLYSQSFKGVCHNLDFDRTKFMDGYEIRARGNVETGDTSAPNQEYKIDSLKIKMRADKAQYFHTIFTTLNVTPIIKYNLNSYDPKVMAKALSPTNNIDILLSTHEMVAALGLHIDLNYPYCITDSGLITQHRGFLTPAEKISRFYTREILYLTGLVLIISLVALIVYNNQGIASAIFEILRLMLGTNFLYALKGNPIRLYFMPVFFLVLILITTFQGNLVGFMTKPEHRLDVLTIFDLRKLKFHVYSSKILNFLIPTDWPKEFSHDSPHLNCSKFVINDSSAACIAPMSFLAEVAIASHLNFRLIVPPVQHYLQVWVRKDWPLIQRVDAINLRLWCSGLIRQWEKQVITIPLEKYAAIFIEESKPQIRKFNLADFKVVFEFYIVALAFSIIIFIIELLIKKFKT